jgi:hypothetical protein
LKELKLAGVRMHDFNKQQADALATLAQFPYLRPSLGVMPGNHRLIFLNGMPQLSRSVSALIALGTRDRKPGPAPQA